MTTEIIAGELGELRAISTASGGTSLTTTATFIVIPDKAYHLFVTPRNFSTAVVAKVALNPYLIVLKTTDGMVHYTDYSDVAQDGDADTHVAVSSLDTVANGDFLLVGSHLPFRGVYVDMDASNVNTTTATLTVSYWNGSWTDSSDTDGTSSSNKTLAQDGLVYWTVPSSWTKAALISIYPNLLEKNPLIDRDQYYWTRWEVNTAIHTSVDIDAMLAANRSTAYSEWTEGQCLEQRIDRGINGLGAIEALTNAGTASLIANVATRREGRF